MSAPASSYHARRFDRAAARYEARADVQARMADALMLLWGERPAPARILEFGCGTGLLTRRLRARFPGASLRATDAAPAMLDVARARLADLPGIDWALADARGVPPTEGLPQGVPPPDLLASGAMVQWFPGLEAHLRFAASCAAPDASYLVSGFGADNFPELNALLAEPPFSYERFPGHAPGAVEEAARATGWHVAALLAWEERETFPTAREVLQRVRDLGAARDPREGGRMTRANLAWLLTEYERRFPAAESGKEGKAGKAARSGTAGGVRLTWTPWAALLTRA